MLSRQVPVFAALLFLLALLVTAAIFETGLPRGLGFKHENSPTPRTYPVEIMGSGVALLDYNNDGLLDIFLVNSGRLTDSMRVPENVRSLKSLLLESSVRQNRDGTFTDVTKSAGLASAGEGNYGMGVAAAVNPIWSARSRCWVSRFSCKGYPNEAIPYLESAHAPDARGIAQVRVGRFTEAIGNLTAALAKRPDDPELLYYLGRASGLLSKEAKHALQGRYPIPLAPMRPRPRITLFCARFLMPTKLS